MSNLKTFSSFWIANTILRTQHFWVNRWKINTICNEVVLKMYLYINSSELSKIWIEKNVLDDINSIFNTKLSSLSKEKIAKIWEKWKANIYEESINSSKKKQIHLIFIN